MKKITPLIFFLFSILQLTAQQRTVAECIVTYKLSADSTVDSELAESLKSSNKILYIKGNNSRTDLATTSFTQTTFASKDTGGITVLRIIGESKLITTVNRKQWVEMNKAFDSAITIPTNETKKILNYDCKRVNLVLKNGDIYTLYYATAITPSVKDFEFLFKKIPGFVLEYEVQELKGIKVKYTATKINLSPVPSSKMEIPKTGYRLLTD